MLEELKTILRGDDEPINFILVEGPRDVESLRFIGVTTPIEIFYHIGQVEHDIIDIIKPRTRSALILTDFDEKGASLAKRITKLLYAEGVQVQIEIRNKIGRLMSVLGLKTVESIDDWIMKNERCDYGP